LQNPQGLKPCNFPPPQPPPFVTRKPRHHCHPVYTRPVATPPAVRQTCVTPVPSIPAATQPLTRRASPLHDAARKPRCGSTSIRRLNPATTQAANRGQRANNDRHHDCDRNNAR
jgi:hypothetical protein